METRISLLEAEVRDNKIFITDVHNDLKIALSGVHKMEAEVRETRKWLDDVRIDLKAVLMAVHSLEISTATSSASRSATARESKDILSRWVAIFAIFCGITSCIIAFMALKHD